MSSVPIILWARLKRNKAIPMEDMILKMVLIVLNCDWY